MRVIPVGRVLRVLAAGVVFSGQAGLAAAADSNFKAEFEIYRLGPIPIVYIAAQASESPEMKAFLDEPVNVQFEKTNLVDALAALKAGSAIEFTIDSEIIQPSGQPNKASPSEPTSHVQSNVGAAGFITDGVIAYAKLQNMARRDALKAILDPLKLAYVVQHSGIRICAADALQHREPVNVADSKENGGGLFADGVLRIGNVEIALGAQRGTSTDDPLAQISDAQLLGRPHILLPDLNQTAEIRLDDQVGGAYLEPKPGSAAKEFVLREAADRTGFSLKLSLAEVSEDSVVADLFISATYLFKRENLEGTTIPAGRPVYQAVAANMNLRTPFENRFAALAVIGDTGNRVLVLGTISRGLQSPKTSAPLPQYSLDTRVIQVRGEPDWQWWTQPYTHAYKISDGAGRVLGPIVVPHLANPPKKFDWGRLGFEAVSSSRPASGSSFDLAFLLDPKFPRKKSPVAFRADTSRPPRPAPDPSHELFALFKKVAPNAPPLTPEDAQGKTFILSQSFAQDANGQPESQCDFFVIGEAAPTSNAALFQVDQKVFLNMPRLGTSSPGLLQQLAIIAEMTDATPLAFLLPIAEDEFWIVLTEFTLVKE